MIQLTSQQVKELWREITEDPAHDCSMFGSWFENQMKIRGTTNENMMQIIGDLEQRKREAFANLLLQKYCSHD